VIATLLIAALALPPDSSAADSARAPHSISASAADTARSSAADSVVMVLPETRIERERPVDPARRRLPTAFTSVIPVGQSNRALESLSEVLGEAAGVHVDRYGGLGAFSTVSMRGSTPGQVSVYLDGAPLMSAGQSVVNLSDLPAGAIDHVEVYRGLSPLAFGPATPGGAINLVTAPAAATREARVTYGSFDTWEARASAGGTRGTLAAQIDGGLQSSRGDFVFLDDHGTPYNLADDREHPRENNRFDAASLFGTLRWRARPNLDVALREDFFHKAQGLPGIGTSTSQNARLASLRSMTQLEIARRAAAGPAPDGAARLLAAPDARFAVSLERQQNRFRDDGGPLGLGESSSGGTTATTGSRTGAARSSSPGRGFRPGSRSRPRAARGSSMPRSTIPRTVIPIRPRASATRAAWRWARTGASRATCSGCTPRGAGTASWITCARTASRARRSCRT